MRLTDQQRRALYVLNEERNRGYDLSEIARRLHTSRNGLGVAVTMSSLVRRNLADSFQSTLGGPHTCWYIHEDVGLCPHGCGLLDWIEDQWHCPKCGDEWHDEQVRS